ncbi:MAG TPA: multifunctional CCA addition/repair protein [Rhodocyclaceae bacterium]|nr:multifunctional CCA addition/repair protein [Rhodocyclaceae bacterium]
MSTAFATYVVGGAVRDKLLGLPVQDRDWVVVGATPEQMIADGFKPVGKDFPVFLHPQTREEYALARTERKVAPGYTGFAFNTNPGVTLEEDLARRDLTINAIAQSESGLLIDPYGGQRDLANRTFRHISDAFTEDPVRILRVARFAARFTDFELAPETLELMRRMVASGEVDHLVPERVWQELSRGLMSTKPSRMLNMLKACGALARLLPEIDALYGVPQPPQHHPEIDTGIHVGLVIDVAARGNQPLPVRFAALMHDLGKGVTPHDNWPHHYGHEALGLPLVENVCARLRVPVDCRELAILATREHGRVHQSMQMRPDTLVNLLESVDALRRPERFEQLLAACICDAQGRTGLEEREYPQAERLRKAFKAFAGVDASVITRAAANKNEIPVKIRAARVEAVALAVSE